MTETLRTPKYPLAFDGWEFVRGAFAAWVIFFVLHQVALLGAGLPILPLSLAFSLAALLVWSAPAWMLGWTMRRQPRIVWHLVAFFAYGCAIGYTTEALIGSFGENYRHIIPLCSGVAVAAGWWLSAHRALVSDRRSSANPAQPPAAEA